MAALTLGVDPNQRNQQGDTALCLAQQRMPPEYSRLLIQKGANPNLPNTARKTPLQIAVQNNAYANVITLLIAGATFSRVEDYFDEPSADQSTMKNFLLNIKLLLQLNDAKTGGMEIVNELLAKEKLIDAIASDLTPKELKCFQKSLALDKTLRSTISPIITEQHSVQSFEARRDALQQAISNMEAYDFLWLSNGCSNHAINTVIKKNSAGHVTLTVINSGDGARHHTINTMGLIQPKLYQCNTPHSPTFDEEHARFQETLAETLSDIYTAYYEQRLLPVDNYYQALDKLTHYKTVVTPAGSTLPQFGEASSHLVPAIDPQGVDNCTSMGMLAALKFISPGHRLPEYLIEKYERSLLDKIKAEYPKFTDSHYHRICEVAKEDTNIVWTLDQARFKLNKAAGQPSLNAKTTTLLQEALSLFTKVHHELAHRVIIDGDEAATKMSDEAQNMISLIRYSIEADLTPSVYIAMIRETQAGHFAPFSRDRSNEKLEY